MGLFQVVYPGRGYIGNTLINGWFGMHSEFFFSCNVGSRRAQSLPEQL